MRTKSLAVNIEQQPPSARRTGPIARTVLLVTVLLSGTISLPNQGVETAASLMAQEPQSYFLHVPASAFVPHRNDISYDTNGGRLLTLGLCCDVQGYHAPVNLPHGALVQEVSLRAHDASGGELGQRVKVVLHLYWFNYFWVMAQAETSGPEAPGDVAVSTDAINWASIDNGNFAYGLQLGLPRAIGDVNNLRLYSVQIKYQMP